MKRSLFLLLGLCSGLAVAAEPAHLGEVLAGRGDALSGL